MSMAEIPKTSAHANSVLGQLYLMGTNKIDRYTPEAAKYFELASNSGDAVAKAFLGGMLIHGVGIDADEDLGGQLIQDAHNLGNKYGTALFGWMHLHGRGGVGMHLDKALQLLTDAAGAGIPDAHFHLAEMHRNGYGVAADFEKALKHYLEAGKYNHIGAKFRAGQILARGRGQINKMFSCEHALNLMKSVSEDGFGYPWPGQHMEDARKSLLLTASFTHFQKWSSGNVGLGAERAVLVYLQAAEMGVEQAQSNVAQLLQFKIGLPKKFPEAERYRLIQHYLHLSSQQGNIGSSVRLGDVKFRSNAKASLAHYMYASDMGNAEASFNLGVIYQLGEVVKSDPHLAKRYYDLALKQSPMAWLPVYTAQLFARCVLIHKYVILVPFIMRMLSPQLFLHVTIGGVALFVIIRILRLRM